MASRGTSLRELWLKALMFTLFCYALFDRSFANFFIGELLLLVGFLLYLSTTKLMLLVSNRILLLFTAFAIWGMARTLPFLSRYHFDAIRDAVLWGYGIYAVLIVAFVTRREQIEDALRAYRKFVRAYPFVAPVLMLISLAFADSMPKIPWSQGVGILNVKAADAAVHLGAGALFLMILPERRSSRQPSDFPLVSAFRVLSWLVSALIVVTVTRGGFSAMVIPIGFVSILRPTKVGWKVAGLAVISVAVGLIVLESNVITFKHHGRTFTYDQVTENIASIVGMGQPSGELQGTKSFRTAWWAQIVGYTVFGPYRWTGKGFGINLLRSDQPPGIGLEDTTDRSPHNGSMTVLARMGITGLALWIALNATFAISIFRRYRRAIAARSTFWSGVFLWILCYWLSIVIDMSFDVYIEGPQGGIWFWCIIGFGVAAMRIQSYEALQTLRRKRMEFAGAVAY